MESTQCRRWSPRSQARRQRIGLRTAKSCRHVACNGGTTDWEAAIECADVIRQPLVGPRFALLSLKQSHETHPEFLNISGRLRPVHLHFQIRCCRREPSRIDNTWPQSPWTYTLS